MAFFINYFRRYRDEKNYNNYGDDAKFGCNFFWS